MEVLIYDEPDGEPSSVVALQKGEGDFWSATLRGDLAGKYYTVRSFQNGEWGLESPGIFAKAMSVNGQKAAIIDLAKTNPEGWDKDQRPAMTDPTDIVVYETHLRDFTMSPYSGVVNKGKFLGLTEETPLNYLRELGITHLQILPFFDYGSIDETTLDQDKYNWGYDPVNYNAPDGGYSTNPYDPACRIREAKQMIQALHQAGIRVIMDVVYNHTYDVMGCALGRGTSSRTWLVARAAEAVVAALTASNLVACDIGRVDYRHHNKLGDLVASLELPRALAMIVDAQAN